MDTEIVALDAACIRGVLDGYSFADIARFYGMSSRQIGRIFWGPWLSYLDDTPWAHLREDTPTVIRAYMRSYGVIFKAIALSYYRRLSYDSCLFRARRLPEQERTAEEQAILLETLAHEEALIQQRLPQLRSWEKYA